jgi:hypothetical protein
VTVQIQEATLVDALIRIPGWDGAQWWNVCLPWRRSGLIHSTTKENKQTKKSDSQMERASAFSGILVFRVTWEYLHSSVEEECEKVHI